MPPEIILKWSFLTRFTATTPFIILLYQKGAEIKAFLPY